MSQKFNEKKRRSGDPYHIRYASIEACFAINNAIKDNLRRLCFKALQNKCFFS